MLHSGVDATLKVYTNAGKAWVTLQAGLGSSPPALFNLPPHGHHVHRHGGTAQQRRRERREAARRAAAATDQHNLVNALNDVLHTEEAYAPAHTNVAEEAAVDASDGKQFVAEKVVEQISVVETDADIHGIFYKICFA